jgi:hypothetical protein
MKAHLAKVFTRLAQHHVAKAKHHGELAKLHDKLSQFHKGMDGEEDPATIHKNISAAHSAASEEHVAMGEECAKCAKGFSASGKAMGMDGDLDDLMPSPISGVTPDAPRAVLRPGMKALPTPEETSLAKVFGTDELD